MYFFVKKGVKLSKKTNFAKNNLHYTYGFK